MTDAADILYQGSWLTVRAITLPGGEQPASDWHMSLDKRGRGQFLAACRALETALSAGRPPAEQRRSRDPARASGSCV